MRKEEFLLEEPLQKDLLWILAAVVLFAAVALGAWGYQAYRLSGVEQAEGDREMWRAAAESFAVENGTTPDAVGRSDAVVIGYNAGSTGEPCIVRYPDAADLQDGEQWRCTGGGPVVLAPERGGDFGTGISPETRTEDDWSLPAPCDPATATEVEGQVVRYWRANGHGPGSGRWWHVCKRRIAHDDLGVPLGIKCYLSTCPETKHE